LKEYPFTQQEAEKLIKQDKYLTDTDLQLHHNKNLVGVYLISNPNSKLNLELRRRDMDISLVWQGERIRGIDYHEKKHRLDCKTIRGWHHHQFRKSCGGKWVEGIDENYSKFRSVEELLRFALKCWNIKVCGNVGLSLLNQGLLDFEGGR